MRRFKYFTIGWSPPHSDVKNFHDFCQCKNYYYKGYNDSYGYKCPICWGNGHSGCKACNGRGKISDRKSIVKEYIVYRREYRKARKYWSFLHKIWTATVSEYTEEQQEALEVFGYYK